MHVLKYFLSTLTLVAVVVAAVFGYTHREDVIRQATVMSTKVMGLIHGRGSALTSNAPTSNTMAPPTDLQMPPTKSHPPIAAPAPKLAQTQAPAPAPSTKAVAAPSYPPENYAPSQSDNTKPQPTTKTAAAHPVPQQPVEKNAPYAPEGYMPPPRPNDAAQSAPSNSAQQQPDFAREQAPPSFPPEYPMAPPEQAYFPPPPPYGSEPMPGYGQPPAPLEMSQMPAQEPPPGWQQEQQPATAQHNYGRQDMTDNRQPQRAEQRAEQRAPRQPSATKPMTPEARESWIAARRAFWEQDLVRAEETYVKLVKENTDEADLPGELGNLFLMEGRSSEAADQYLEAGMRALKNSNRARASAVVSILNRVDPAKAEVLRQKVFESRVNRNRG